MLRALVLAVAALLAARALDAVPDVWQKMEKLEGRDGENALIKQQQHWRAAAAPDESPRGPGLSAALHPRFQSYALRIAAMIVLPPMALLVGCVLLRCLRRRMRAGATNDGDADSDDEHAYDPLPYTSVKWNGVEVSAPREASVPRERRGSGPRHGGAGSSSSSSSSSSRGPYGGSPSKSKIRSPSPYGSARHEFQLGVLGADS